MWAGQSLAQFVNLCQQTIIWVSVFLVYLSSQFLQFLCKILHNLSAYIVPICQLVSSKSLNFVFRTTSLVNAPFREMFCKHFKTHINRGERQKLKTLLFQNQIFISKKSLIPKQSFDVMFQEVQACCSFVTSFSETHITTHSFL